MDADFGPPPTSAVLFNYFALSLRVVYAQSILSKLKYAVIRMCVKRST